MPAKERPKAARAAINQSEERVKDNAKLDSSCIGNKGASSEAKGVVVECTDRGEHVFPLSRQGTEELGGLMMREQKTASDLAALCDSQNYVEIVSCASLVILARREFESKYFFGKGITFFGIAQVEIFRYRAIAYEKLEQFQLSIDDANAGLDLLASFAGQNEPTKTFSFGQEKISVNDMIAEHKKCQQRLLCLRSVCFKSLGDKDRAFDDLRAAVALERQMGYDLSEGPLWTYIMISMAEMKIGSPRPHFTDDEIRAWNKELQIKEYSIKNRICSNCRKNPSASTKLKICGGCKKAWFCGSECLTKFWPNHKSICRHPVKKYTIIPPNIEASVWAGIAEKGYYNVIDDNGPAIIVCDSRTGWLHESLSDQDVFFVDETQSQEAINKELLRQLSLRSCKE